MLKNNSVPSINTLNQFLNDSNQSESSVGDISTTLQNYVKGGDSDVPRVVSTSASRLDNSKGNSATNLLNYINGTDDLATEQTVNDLSSSMNGVKNSRIAFDDSSDGVWLNRFLGDFEENKKKFELYHYNLDQRDTFQGPIADFCFECFDKIRDDMSDMVNKFYDVAYFIREYVPSMYKKADEEMYRLYLGPEPEKPISHDLKNSSSNYKILSYNESIPKGSKLILEKGQTNGGYFDGYRIYESDGSYYLAIYRTFSTGGYGMGINDVKIDGNKVDVSLGINAPNSNEMVTQAFQSRSAIVKFDFKPEINSITESRTERQKFK